MYTYTYTYLRVQDAELAIKTWHDCFPIGNIRRDEYLNNTYCKFLFKKGEKVKFFEGKHSLSFC